MGKATLAKYIIFIALVLFTFSAGPYILFGVPETATGYGIAMVSVDSAGTAIAALGMGAIGLFYKRNRFAGFVVGTFIAIGFMFVDSNAQTSCQFDGTNVKLCGVPSDWKAVAPRARAAAEFHRNDGFFAQLIIDAAGSDQAFTLSTAADEVIRNSQHSMGGGGFEVLMRGKNSGIRSSEIVVYRAQLEGIPFIFANTIYVGKRETIQLVTWRISDELTDEDRAAHLDFGRGLVLMPKF